MGLTSEPDVVSVLDAKLQSLALLAWADRSERAGELVIQGPTADGLAERMQHLLQQWGWPRSP